MALKIHIILSTLKAAFEFIDTSRKSEQLAEKTDVELLSIFVKHLLITEVYCRLLLVPVT